MRPCRPKRHRVPCQFPKWAFIAYVVLSLATIALLPTLVPSPPSASDSYLFGYDNRAGIVLLLIFVLIGVLWTRGLNLEFFPSRDSRSVPKTTLDSRASRGAVRMRHDVHVRWQAQRVRRIFLSN